MNLGKHIKISVFLFSILFSFLASAYNSYYQQPIHHCKFAKELLPDGQQFATAIQIVKELEDDDDIKGGLNANLFAIAVCAHLFAFTDIAADKPSLPPVRPVTQPIFISIQVFRI